MKQNKIFLAAFLLVLGLLAPLATAEPAGQEGLPEPGCPFPPSCNDSPPASDPAVPLALVPPALAISAPADVFGASLLTAGDCGEAKLAGSAAFQLLKCGACSSSPCAGANTNSVCGTGGGGLVMRCISDGFTCSDSRPNCTCRTGPI